MHRRHVSDEARRRFHRAKSKQNTAAFKESERFVAHIVQGTNLDLDGLLEQQMHEHYYGEVSEAEFANAIFDPHLDDIRSLAPGLLDQKEELLAPSMIPRTPNDLRQFCERQILVASDRRELLEEIAAGWPLSDRGERLGNHVARLSKLHDSDPNLHDAIVSGRHRTAAIALRPLRTSDPRRYEHLLSTLIVQALLWCAHDMQMVVARIACASNPFGELISSSFTTLAPGSARNLMRARRLSLEHALDGFYGHRDWRFGEADPLPGVRNTSELESDPLVAKLRAMVETEQSRSGRNTEANGDWALIAMPEIAKHLRNNNAFALDLTTSEKAPAMPKNFAQIWFTGLSPVVATSVAVLRYLQAEQQIRGIIEEIVPIKGVAPVARYGTALPAFGKRDLLRGSLKRAKRLVGLYRSAVLQDRDWEAATDAMSENAGEQAIGKAVEFLELLGDRRIRDHRGDRQTRRRTYYLLDIVPEHRLAI